MNNRRWMRTAAVGSLGIVFLLPLVIPGTASADDEVDLLKQRLGQMSQENEAVQKKLEDLEKKEAAKEEEFGEMDDINSPNALNPVIDKVFDGYLNLTFRY